MGILDDEKDAFDLSFFELVHLLKRYTQAVKKNDVFEINQLMQKHAEIFSDEFRDYIREWLDLFGVNQEHLNFLGQEDDDNEVAKPILLH